MFNLDISFEWNVRAHWSAVGTRSKENGARRESLAKYVLQLPAVREMYLSAVARYTDSSIGVTSINVNFIYVIQGW